MICLFSAIETLLENDYQLCVFIVLNKLLLVLLQHNRVRVFQFLLIAKTGFVVRKKPTAFDTTVVLPVHLALRGGYWDFGTPMYVVLTMTRVHGHK